MGLSLLMLAAQSFLWSQDALTAKERHAFNEKFFEAKAHDAKGDFDQAFQVYRSLHAMDPENALVNYELAQLYTNENREDSAIFHAEKASTLDPQNQWYTYLRAKVYEKFGYTQKQVQLYQSLLAQEPTSEEYRYELAQAYLANKQVKEALQELNKLEEQLGKNEALTDLKKNIYLNQGNLEKAVQEVHELIEVYPQTLEYYGTLGQLYSVNGFPEKALEVYQQMLQIDSLDPRPHLDLANYYRTKQNYAQSLYHLKIALRSNQLDLEKKIPVLLSLFNASATDTALRAEVYGIMEYLLKTDAQDPRIYTMYGDYLSRDGRDQEALESYKQALRLKGGQKFQIWEQVLLIQVQNDKYDSLAVYAPRAIESFPNQPLPYFFAGVAHAMLNKHQEAVYFLEDGLSYLFGNQRLKEQFYVQLAAAHHQLNNHSESDDYFEKALQINGNNPTALNNYAYYLSLRKENLDKALALTQKSNELSPDNPVFLDTWAWVLYQKGAYTQALQKMEKVMALLPIPDGEVLEHYGDILKANGLKAEALKQYQKALESGLASESLKAKIKALQ